MPPKAKSTKPKPAKAGSAPTGSVPRQLNISADVAVALADKLPARALGEMLTHQMRMENRMSWVETATAAFTAVLAAIVDGVGIWMAITNHHPVTGGVMATVATGAVGVKGAQTVVRRLRP